MAEPLQRLFTDIRSRRRPITYDPFEGFSGPNPGMRGTMPANALDTQDMTDTAQGIDISSIAPPTRLNASQIDPEAYAAGTQGMEGEEGEPGQAPIVPAGFMAQFRGGQPTCTGPNCPGGGGLPEGVTLGPGEKFVQGSLREVPVQASAAPAQPQPAPAPAAQQTAANYEDPSFYLQKSQQSLDAARKAAGSQQAVLASIEVGASTQFLEAGLTALMYRKQAEMAERNQKLADRGFALQEKKLKSETGELRREMEAAIASDRTKTVQERVGTILKDRFDDATRGGVPYTAEQQKEDAKLILGTVTAGDLAHYLQGALDAVAVEEQAAANGTLTPEMSADIQARQALITARANQVLMDRYREVPPEQRAGAMANELIPIYEDVFRKHYSRNGQKATDSQVQSAAIDYVQGHIADMDDLMAEDSSPMGAFLQSLGRRPSPAPAKQAAPQSYSPADTSGVMSSGTTPDGGVLLNDTGTMSLAR